MSEITQQNLYLLLPFKVSWVADMLAEDEHISTIEAIRRVYSSAMYKRYKKTSLTDVKQEPRSENTDSVKKRREKFIKMALLFASVIFFV